MRLLACFFFLLLFHDPDVTEIRKIYPTAAKSEKIAGELLAKLESIDHKNPILVAYKGAALTLKSKFSKKVLDKIEYFKAGAKLIESAVSSEPRIIEIRVIRLSVQENVPGIVNYKKNIKEDAAFIYARLQEIDGPLRDYVVNFILNSKSFSAEQKQAIRR